MSMIAHVMPVALAVLLIAGVADAGRYVSPDGDDAGPGTQEQPWRTVQHAADSAGPGDTIHLAPGRYNERVVASRSGAEGQPVTFLGAPDHASVLDGAGLPRTWGLFEMHGQAHVVIDGLKVTNSRGVGILIHESGNVTVRNCLTDNTGSSGIMAWQSSDVAIVHNEVTRACQRGGEESVTIKFDSERVEVAHNHIHHTQHEGIDVKEGSRHVSVHDNYLHHVQRQALYADAWNKETYDIEFRDNVVHDSAFGLAMCAETGGLLHDVRAVGNVIYNCPGPGLVVADWGRRGDPHPIRDVAFEHNTVHNCGTEWGGGMLIENTEAEGVVVRANIISAGGPPYILINRMPAALTIDGNLFHGSEGDMGDKPVEADPLFVDPESGDFHLRGGSPAIIPGEPRDLGALEHTPEM